MTLASLAFARKDSSQIHKQFKATVWDCVAGETGTRELLSKAKISSSSESVIESNSRNRLLQRLSECWHGFRHRGLSGSVVGSSAKITNHLKLPADCVGSGGRVCFCFRSARFFSKYYSSVANAGGALS